jgi:hypothetical protein
MLEIFEHVVFKIKGINIAIMDVFLFVVILIVITYLGLEIFKKPR